MTRGTRESSGTAWSLAASWNGKKFESEQPVQNLSLDPWTPGDRASSLLPPCPGFLRRTWDISDSPAVMIYVTAQVFCRR